MRTVGITAARRLAITKQRLSGPEPAATREGIMETVRSIGCLQLDPISVVARNHLLVLWSRLGSYRVEELDALLWEERKLFEYWAHAASLVLTEEYPIQMRGMRWHHTDQAGWEAREKEWLEKKSSFREYVLGEIRERGPLQAKEFADTSSSSWTSTNWSDERNITGMLDRLWMRGEVMVAGRKNGQRLWDLAERVLPDWTPREALSDRNCTHIAAQKSLRMLGVATSKQIKNNYTRYRYPHLPQVLRGLEHEGVIQKVAVGDDGNILPGTWYIHRDDLPILEEIEAGDWQPRTTLLSPFDNLIAYRERTEALFDYRFRVEIYVPKHRREYGYYVMSILHGDRIIGRIDPVMDRKAKRLNINAVYAEPYAPMTTEAAQCIASSIANLATFLGARSIDYGERVPAEWRPALIKGA
ncbi:MAG: crosslink repair DNA glycosylase YcaQ family protein [Chloroflexia bacterium]